ncbi:alginate export family protein [Neptunicella sp.]|uniref:alginate export family protein n=1 Tax=Neptunicella sp. TaxID=2125986 RepID=UPI003F68D68C
MSKNGATVFITLVTLVSQSVWASSSTILTDTKASIDMRLRYETVEQDNALKSANGLTLRSRFNFVTGSQNGFSAMFELEDSRSVMGLANYNNGIGSHPDYSVIADPNTTELDQAFVQYKNTQLTIKLGRQVIALDGQRFVGHVGWRQDRQTFDGLSTVYQPNKALTLTYGYINQRNRIFAEQKDIDSKDHLFNAAYQSSIGTISGYGYLLEMDNGTENGLDTWGMSFAGKNTIGDSPVSYRLEFASQDADSSNASFSANYLAAEAGIALSEINIKLGYESLGSDNGLYGFATPLATLHKFNGWSDQFLNTPKEGLDDLYISIAGKLMGGSWTLTYHDFSAEQSSASLDDLGNEIDALYSKKLNEHFSGGIKLACYSAGDNAAGKVDTNKLWLWLGVNF